MIVGFFFSDFFTKVLSVSVSQSVENDTAELQVTIFPPPNEETDVIFNLLTVVMSFYRRALRKARPPRQVVHEYLGSLHPISC